MRPPRHARRSGLLLLAAVLCLRALGDVGPLTAPARMAFPDIMPQTVLWAWEEPEDLRAADPAKVGVAYLARTLLLGDSRITTLPRHQPLEVPEGMAVMAVVRIQTQLGFRDSPALRQQTAGALAEVSRHPGLRALQVDFDATRSERVFYAGVLHALRPQMPSAMPLSITALASWCAADPTSGPQQDWLARLPIDEAVPMFFRLGGHGRPYDDKSWIPIRQPLCRASIGLSTDESWPEINSAARVYLFAPRPWFADQLAAAASLRDSGRADILRQPNRSVGDLSSLSSVTRLRTYSDAPEDIRTEEEQ
jgi:hypothetical protein